MRRALLCWRTDQNPRMEPTYTRPCTQVKGGRECELEIPIVLWITAIGDPRGRLKPDGSMAQYFQDPLTPCKRDCTGKPGTVQDPDNLTIDGGREREHIDFLGTQQRAFRNAVGLERRTYES